MQKSNLCTFLLIVFNFLLIVANFQLAAYFWDISIEKTVNILDFISVIVTICIAIFIPFLIKKSIDDRRGIKALLISEVEDIIEIVKKNHTTISDLFVQGLDIEDKCRDNVRDSFFDTELKIDSLKSQLEISYPSKIKIANSVFENTLIYKQFLTDGKFMNSSYTKIDYDFYRDEKNAFAAFQKCLVQQIHYIHKL